LEETRHGGQGGAHLAAHHHVDVEVLLGQGRHDSRGGLAAGQTVARVLLYCYLRYNPGPKLKFIQSSSLTQIQKIENEGV